MSDKYIPKTPYGKFLIGIGIPLLILIVPESWFMLGDITVLEHRLLAIFAFAVLFWVLEPIPVFATSVAIIMLQLLLISDKGLLFLRGPGPEASAEAQAAFGQLISYKDLMATFASPIIMLFLGGFFLAMSATKFRLDTNLARVLLRPFGSSPPMVMLGLMAITALFSMFMSNTATTAMMLAVLVPVLNSMDDSDKGRIGYILSIPFAANIGGIGTPIGTPPNAVAQKYLTGDTAISFGEWMIFGVPYVIVMLLVAWFILLKIFPISTNSIEIAIKGTFLKTKQAYLVYVVFALTVLLWLTGSGVHGMSSHVVALIPVTVFVATGIITSEDLKKLSWDVLWLVAGGIALGLGLGKTGLSSSLVEAVPFAQLPLLLVPILAGVLALTMSTFMSNTATANLLLPIMAALGTSLVGLDQLGGGQMLIIAITFACSLAMAMPISTPPNALAHATGLLTTRQMALSGAIIGVIGLVLTGVMIYIMQLLGMFSY